jgi:hypothetical protein
MIFSQLCLVDGEGLLLVPQRRSDMKLQVKRAYKRARGKYCNMTRPDQGHLSPKLEVPALTGPGRESNPGLLSGSQAL